MLSEKYIAGFLDSDGSIQVMWRPVDRGDTNPDIRRGYLSLDWSQKTCQDEVLFRIQECIGGKLETNVRGPYSRLRLFGSPAEMVLNRIKQHLVIKRHYAEIVLDAIRKPQSIEVIHAHLKAQRKVKSLPLPNYPSRKWLAGYFDGDGCISVRIGKFRQSAQPAIEIVASEFDSEGVELLQKVFGGYIGRFNVGKSNIVKWTLTMPPSKANHFFGQFSKYLITKREQANFILGCARMGHYQDGKNIQRTLKQLKAQPHRLNEPKVDVSLLLQDVNDVRVTPGPGYTSRRETKLMRQSDYSKE